MSESRRCPQCDAEIPVNSPAGLCPRCLLKASADSQSAGAAEPGPTNISPPASGFVPPTVEELAPLFPQLEILELLGKGGMGAVYKARQPGLDRLVAVKILPPEISHDPAFAERFQREARALARLSHPHIVAVYDFGQTLDVGWPPSAVSNNDAKADGRGRPSYYIVMEFVDGANLRQAMRTGTLTSAEALAIVPQICEALQFAHDEGIVHRDIKPENILIDKRGRVKIADFGLAKLMANGGRESPGASLTATHQVMGTLRYMAPEQMQGSREVDHRADIYSLGVVFYELLTGELPMGKFAPPSKRVQVDVRLDEVVLRALEQDPEQRYQHASEVKIDVENVTNNPASAPAAIPSNPVAEKEFSLVMNVLVIMGVAASMFAGASLISSLATTVPFADKSGDILHWSLMLGFAICSLVLLILAYRRERHSFATLGAINAALAAFSSNHVGGFAAALIAAWCWLVLRKPDVASLFRDGNALSPADTSATRQSATVEKTETGQDLLPGPHLVQGPADCLLLAAGIAIATACGVAVWLIAIPAYSSNQFTNSMIRGNLAGMSVGLAIYSVLIGVAGLMLRRLRVRLFVLLVDVIVGLFFPAVIALNVVMELRNIPVWPVVIPLWLGVPAAQWVVVTLFRDDVRRAFVAAAEQRTGRVAGVESAGQKVE